MTSVHLAPDLPGPFPGATSVWLGGLDGVPWWVVDAERAIYPASLPKVVWVGAAHRMAARGELDLDRPVPVHADFTSVVDAASYRLAREDDEDDETWADLGGETALHELCRRAVQWSGNLAANLVIEHLAAGEAAAVLAEAGCSGATRLPTGIGDRASREHGIRNQVTAHDLGRVLVHTPTSVEELMRGQRYRDAIPTGLGRVGVAPGVIANKTGWVDAITHDMAIVRPAGAPPYALVVLTEHDTTYAAANAHIADVADMAAGVAAGVAADTATGVAAGVEAGTAAGTAAGTRAGTAAGTAAGADSDRVGGR